MPVGCQEPCAPLLPESRLFACLVGLLFNNRSTSPVLISPCELQDFWGTAGGAVVSVGWVLLGVCMGSPHPNGRAKSWVTVAGACVCGSETGASAGRHHPGDGTETTLGGPLGFGISGHVFRSCLHPLAFWNLGLLTRETGLLLHPLQHFVMIRDSRCSTTHGIV